MLNLFVLIIGIIVGKITYSLALYLLRRYRGEKVSNTIISIITAILSGLGFAQLVIEYCH